MVFEWMLGADFFFVFSILYCALGRLKRYKIDFWSCADVVACESCYCLLTIPGYRDDKFGEMEVQWIYTVIYEYVVRNQVRIHAVTASKEKRKLNMLNITIIQS